MISILSQTVAPVLGAMWLVGGAIILLLFGKQNWPGALAVSAVAMIICGAIILASGSAEVRLFSLAAGVLIGSGLTLQAFRN